MSSFGLEGAIIPVSGGASGIGLEICRRLRAQGATPLLLDYSPEHLDFAVREVFADDYDPTRFGYLVDVSDAQGVNACFDSIAARHGIITHAVSCAGIVSAVGILDVTDEQWLRVMDVNLNGTMYFCRAAGRQLAAAGRGSIVTIASVGGIMGKQDRSPYAASKAGVINLTRVLALDLGRMGVRANVVAPGVVETPIQVLNDENYRQAVAEKTALGRWGRAGEIADVTLFLLSDLASYVTGAVIVADGGLTARYA